MELHFWRDFPEERNNIILKKEFNPTTCKQDLFEAKIFTYRLFSLSDHPIFRLLY